MEKTEEPQRVDNPRAKESREPGGRTADKLHRAATELREAAEELQETASSITEAGERISTLEAGMGLKRDVAERAIAEMRLQMAQLKEQVAILVTRTRHLPP